MQAEAQLAGSGITLMREGTEGVPQLPAWLKAHLPAEGAGRTVGFDGRVVDLKLGRELAASFPLRWELDLSDQVWAQRPPLAASAIYALPWEVTGESAASKLGRIRRAMREAGADYHLITSLEEIAWIWNLRASDVTHTPVFYAFMLLTPQETRVYLLNETQEAAKLFHAALQEGGAARAHTLIRRDDGWQRMRRHCCRGGWRAFLYRGRRRSCGRLRLQRKSARAPVF